MTLSHSVIFIRLLWLIHLKYSYKTPRLAYYFCFIYVKSLWNVYIKLYLFLRAACFRVYRRTERMQRPWMQLDERLCCLVIDIWEACWKRILTALTSRTLIIRNSFPDDNTLRMRAFLKNQTRLSHLSEVSFPNEMEMMRGERPP